jgi:hypothetical protein
MKEIQLSKTGKKNKGKYKALIDNDVFEEVNKFDWHYNNGYARNGKMNILLHRFIWELKVGEIPEALEVEHKDQNGLNCQISNLRLANRSENNCNKTKYKNNTSGFKGISKVVQRHQHKDKIYTYEYFMEKINYKVSDVYIYHIYELEEKISE